MPDAAAIRRVALISAAFLFVRIASMVIVSQPGYTDAYYYADVATRLARGAGLTADFVWNPLELGPLPIVSHRFWMPLATVLQGGGIAALGAVLGDFRAAQAAIVITSVLVTPAAYVCARLLAASERAALVAAAIVGLGGLFAPAWVTLDGFAPAALIGALFFIAFAFAARGNVRAGAAAGALVGLLYLTRAEGALFGLALVALAMRSSSRGAGLAGTAVALSIGAAWFARNAAVGIPSDLFARTALLVRYEDFFAVRSPTLDGFLAAFSDVLAAKGAALITNAITFAFAFALLPVVALVAGARGLWARMEVRAWVALAILVFAAQSLLWTLHSTRGSYFHSLGAFYPFGIAIAVAGGERLLASRSPGIAAAWLSGTMLLVVALSGGALAQWDAAFNDGARARAAVVDSIPDGPFLAIDAAAWRWIAGRSVFVTPSDGIAAAACVIASTGARSIVLEEAHFSRYDGMYTTGTGRPSWLGVPIERGTVKIYPVVASAGGSCAR